MPRSRGDAASDEARARRHILGIIALIFALLMVVAIYLGAQKFNAKHGPVPPEKEWWRQYGGPTKMPGDHGYHRRNERY